MDDLPELVHEVIQYEGKTYWAVPDYDHAIYENACHGCKFKDMSFEDCQAAISKPIIDNNSWCCPTDDRTSVIWINEHRYSRYIKQRTIDRLEKPNG